jgi:hypothetical protein
LYWIYYNKIKESLKLPNCDKCGNNGVHWFKEIIDGHEYELIAACNCDWGNKAREKIPNIALYDDIIQRKDGDEELPF